MCDRAVILAGGMGTRLRPYTVVLPKPLMPIGEYPILEVVLRQLARCGFRRVTMAVNHQAELIQAFFGNGARWGLEIDYSLESKALSTIGPLKLIQDLPERFLLMNGDILTDLNFREFCDSHAQAGHLFTIAAASRTQVVDYGVLEVDGANVLSCFKEKPTHRYLVSMGVYAVSRSLLERVPSNVKYGFDDLMRDMLARGEAVRVEPYNGYWLDIGRPDDYERAIDEFEQHRKKLLPDE
ncbi:MAG TPA: sugar phosphate nucleotidyltransferase [Bryobacteraceae bacterium]